MLDLSKLYGSLEDAVEQQTEILLSKTKNDPIDVIRYHIGYLNGLKTAHALIHTTIVKGGDDGKKET